MNRVEKLIRIIKDTPLLLKKLETEYKGKRQGRIYTERFLKIGRDFKYANKELDKFATGFIYTYYGILNNGKPFMLKAVSQTTEEEIISIVEYRTKSKVALIQRTDKEKLGLVTLI